MPHPRCSICTHPKFEAINQMLQAGESVRVVAKQFGMSSAAVHRHQHEDDRKKPRINIGQIAHIDEEIKKLKRAEKRARKKRDTTGALAIARELRNWFVLRGKAELITSAIQTTETDSTPLSRGEAVSLAQALIESEATAGSQEIRSWLTSLLERMDANKNTVAAVAIEEREPM